MKKPTMVTLAKYLNRNYFTVAKYPKLKTNLMLHGLWKLRELEADIDSSLGIKKPIMNDVADYLGKAKSTVTQYSKIKRDLMLHGVWKIKSLVKFSRLKKMLEDSEAVK